MPKTNLPDDGFFLTETDGMNYGLDGLLDVEYGEGVLDGARLPETKGLSGLPIGIVSDPVLEESTFSEVMEDDAYGDSLGEFLKESSLANLDWLDVPLGAEGVDRTPKVPDSIPELEDAWSGLTDGVSLIPNDASPRKAGGTTEDRKMTNARLVKEVIREASLRSARREPIRSILERVSNALGPDLAPKAIKAAQDLVSEHGLLGNVYVRSSHYPSLLNGKWASYFKKHFADVRYILADDPKTAALDRIHGKEVVTEIPWKEAFRHYAPRLKAGGRKVASASSEAGARSALKRAFLSEPVAPKTESHLPTHTPLSDRISSEDAVRDFESLSTRLIEKVSRHQEDAKRERSTLHRQLDKWASSGVLDRSDVEKLKASSAPAHLVLKAAQEIRAASLSKSAKYSGEGVGAHTPVTRKSAFRDLGKAEREIRDRVERNFSDSLDRIVKAGLATEEEIAVLRDTSVPISVRHKAAADFNFRKSVRKYSNHVYTPHTGGRPKQEIKPLPQSKSKVLRVAKQLMSEGVTGDDLHRVLSDRFGAENLSKVSKEIGAMRSFHEGKAGISDIGRPRKASKTASAKGGRVANYDPEEFNLGNDALNGFEYDPDTTGQTETIEVGFGGLLIGD